jgi:hypothetical protein
VSIYLDMTSSFLNIYLCEMTNVPKKSLSVYVLIADRKIDVCVVKMINKVMILIVII